MLLDSLSVACRGLGLAYVKCLLADPSKQVIAAARRPAASEALQHLASEKGSQLSLLTLDVTDKDSISVSA